MAGRWLSIESAFARVVEIEGTPGSAFPIFCAALHSNEVEVVATRRQLLCQYEEERGQDDRVDWFRINREFWRTVCLCLTDGVFSLEGYMCNDDPFLVNDKEYDPFVIEEWSLAVLQTSLDACISNQPRILPSVQNLVKRGVGGAPAKYDWAGAGACIAAYIVENDYPGNRDTLRKYLKDWFSSKGLSPDYRDVGKFVDQVYQEEHRLKADRKTRFPEFSVSST